VTDQGRAGRPLAEHTGQGPSLAGARVLAIAPTPFFSDYGCHVRIAEEIAGLHAFCVDTSLVTYPFGRDLADIPTHRAPRLGGPRRISPGSSLHKFSMDATLAGLALRVGRRVRPHLVHGHLHEGALIGYVVARRRRVPLVFDFQGSLTAEMIDHGFLSPRSPAFRVFRALERWIVAHADVIVTSTTHGADLLVRDFGRPADSIVVVPDGVNTQRFRPAWEDAGGPGENQIRALRQRLGLPDAKHTVVYLGLLAEYQGITHLLRAIETLADRHVDAHYVIMGFPGEERYRILARRLGIDAYVTFTGAVPYEQAGAYLALGDLAVSPKLSLTEGNGKLVNYMAMGLPIVVYDSPVSRETLGELGIYAPSGDWSALAVEIERALSDPGALVEQGRALRARAIALFGWERSAARLAEVYERAINGAAKTRR